MRLRAQAFRTAIAGSIMLLTGVQATAAAISITNPDFEDLVLGCLAGPSCFALGQIPGWAVSTINQTATFRPSIGPGGIFPNGIPNGNNVAAVGNQQGTGFITQTLSAVLLADTEYALSVAVGARADFPFSGYFIELLAGTNLLATSSALSPQAGQFLTDSFTFLSTGSTLGLGEALTIRLGSVRTGAQVDFDAVSLVANSRPQPVPEPSAPILVASALLAAFACSRRVTPRQDA